MRGGAAVQPGPERCCRSNCGPWFGPHGAGLLVLGRQGALLLPDVLSRCRTSPLACRAQGSPCRKRFVRCDLRVLAAQGHAQASCETAFIHLCLAAFPSLSRVCAFSGSGINYGGFYFYVVKCTLLPASLFGSYVAADLFPFLSVYRMHRLAEWSYCLL